MKKIVLMILMLCFFVLGCKDTDENTSVGDGGITPSELHDGQHGTDEISRIETDMQLNSVDFDAQYIRTDGYREGVRYPIVTVIHSPEELNAYYETNKDIYSLERRTGTIYSDSTVGFLDACDKYGAEYFEDRILVLVLLEEGSGSVRHKVEGVSSSDGELQIDIKTIVPEICTDDMAEWHIFIEPEAGVDVSDEDAVTVFLNGRNATEKFVPVYYSKGNANISLTLPEGWEYSVEDDGDVPDFAVSIYLSGESEKRLRIGYFNSFGVCGTGLKSEKIDLGNHSANRGTYDDGDLWSFITVTDAFGDYVIFNESDSQWWSKHGDTAMKILSTLKVGEGYASRSEVLETAMQKADSDGKNAIVHFDSKEQRWEVTLSGKNTNGETTFIIDIYGNIADIIDSH